jgi:rhodanese-related sulfurtransferase
MELPGLILLFILAAVIALPLLARLTLRPNIEPAAARKLLSHGAVLIDVRSADEFARRALPGAVNLPLPELLDRVNSLEKTRPVIVYCQSGSRSAMAARVLRRVGFGAVFNLGAMSRWDEPVKEG